MDHQLAPTNLAVRFGGQTDLDAMILRIASIFSIEESAIRQFSDVQGTLMTAAQWMYVYGAMPQKHLYLIPFHTKYKYQDKGQTVTDWRTKFSCADSFEWRMSSAQQQADERRLILRPDVHEILEDQIQARFARLGLTDNVHGGPFHPEDILYKARILVEDRDRSPKKSPPPEPANVPWHYGWWKRFARLERNGNDGKWMPDNVPNGRTREWVAVKRCTKSALAFEYELRPVKGWLHLDDRQRLRRIHEETDEVPQSHIDEVLNNAFFAQREPLSDAELNGTFETPIIISPAPVNPLTMSLYA